jgi:hypothetical protein
MRLWIYAGVVAALALTLHFAIPKHNFVSIAIYVILGRQGTEMAWKSPGRRWESVEQFERTQHVWKIWGLVMIGISFVVAGLILLPLFLGHGVK